MISFAQNFEDVMLYRVFRDRPTGFYIDVGAADPVHHSVTKWFYDLGWHGINIEPRRAFFEALQRARPRDINLDCAAGAERGEAVFYELSQTHEWSSLDVSVRAAAMERDETTIEYPIKVRPLSEIIEQHASGQPVDFIKIDVEGWEPHVLKGLDLKKHRPTILIIEATKQGTAEQNDAAWSDTLVDANYRCIYFDGLNKFFLDGGHQELASHFSVPPNVFDDFVPADLASTTAKLKETEAECARRRDAVEQKEKQIGNLSKQLQDVTAAKKRIETESEERLAGVHILSAAVNQFKEDSEERLAQIHTLTAMVHSAQASNEALTEEVHALTKTLETSCEETATRDRMLEDHRNRGLCLEKTLKETQDSLGDLEMRHAESLREIAELAPRAAQHDLLISDLRVKDGGPRSLKIVLPLARALRRSATVFRNLTKAR